MKIILMKIWIKKVLALFFVFLALVTHYLSLLASILTGFLFEICAILAKNSEKWSVYCLNILFPDEKYFKNLNRKEK